MKHLSDIKYPGGLKQLAVDIGDLKYDSLQNFLELLSKKMGEDAEADLKRNRKKLSRRLKKTSELLAESAGEIKVAWEISKPHMK